MSLAQAIFQGIIQGLTEFLPVSSSGHLSLYQYFTGQSGEAAALFSVFLHLGTLLAVFIAFWGTIWDLILEFFDLLKDIFTGNLKHKRVNPKRRMIYLLMVSLLPLFLALIFKDPIRSVAEDNSIVIEGICFLVTSILLFLADRLSKGIIKAQNMPFSTAISMGAMQTVAALPGISRSGSTLSAGLFLGLDTAFALSFSFIMGIPAVIAAVIIDIPSIINSTADISIWVMVAGFLTSAIFGVLAIGMVKWLVASRKLKLFGYYTLFIGVLTLSVGIFDTFSNHAIQSMVISFFSR